MNDAPPSVLEKYARATRTSDLTMGKSHQGFKDADVLLAAGYAGRRGGREALLINRMLVTGDYKQLGLAIVVSKRWLMGAMHHRRALPKMNSTEVNDVANVTLRWWLSGVCPHCEGRGKELVYPGAQVTSTHDCKRCDGIGRAPLERVARPHVEAARFLADMLDRLMDQVSQDMAQALRRSGA